MSSYAAHNLRTKKVPTSPSSPAATAKPLRPLTAYHMFFQLEREFIIQTTAGPDADPSCHANKSYLPDVPRRYRAIKLNADWYAGPGKRQKRKHRKSHGKIGFLELSRVISKRWATLDSADPDTKRYVSKIAQKELATYKVEIEEWKEATKHSTPSAAPAKPASTRPAAKKAKKAFRRTRSVTISPTSSPCASPAPMEMCAPLPPLPSLSLDQDFSIMDAVSLEDEIDYSICCVSQNGHYLPSPSPVMGASEGNAVVPDGSINDPLFEWIDGFFSGGCQPAPVESSRCVSPVASAARVDTFSSNDMLQLLSGVRS
ncbi:hypothetical protein ACHAXT_004027 [Thalassiosira profunda]